MEKIIELYGQGEVDKRRRAGVSWTVAVCVFSALCLAACITLCCFVDVRNVQNIMLTVMTIAVVGGWVAIYILVSVIAENRHEAIHAANMLDGQREEYCGSLSVESKKIKISGSITIVKAVLSDGDKSEKFNLNVTKAKKIKNIRGRIKLYAVHGYVVAIGVDDENN